MAALDATEVEALDAYSTTVIGVAERLTRSVASLRVITGGRGGRRTGGTGSAVTISPDGYLLTSAHVVAAAPGGEAVFVDGSERPFTVVGRDPLSDLAVVRVQASDLAAAELGDADRLRVGQLVVAVGNPMGYSGSVTAGVVSALGRSVVTRAGSVTRVVEDVIQTDAALNPGNSGGALADSHSRVVGVNTAVAGIGLGLAVPINATTQRILGALIAEGRVRRAYMGIAGGTRALPQRAAHFAGHPHGLEVVEVVEGSPAMAAGLRRGDIIVSVDGAPLQTAGALQRLMTAEAIGRPLAVRALRDDRAVDIIVTPVELSAAA
jgi:S1-C subfamily serine protease